MITIVPYNPAWPAEFRAIAAGLRQALGELALRIDHIGSTAVPGLRAKDIVDIQITVRSLDPEIERRLAAPGYRRRMGRPACNGNEFAGPRPTPTGSVDLASPIQTTTLSTFRLSNQRFTRPRLRRQSLKSATETSSHGSVAAKISFNCVYCSWVSENSKALR